MSNSTISKSESSLDSLSTEPGEGQDVRRAVGAAQMH